MNHTSLKIDNFLEKEASKFFPVGTVGCITKKEEYLRIINSDIVKDFYEKDKFSIEEIKNYLKSKDSFGDVMYFLNVDNIKKAQIKPEEDEDN